MKIWRIEFMCNHYTIWREHCHRSSLVTAFDNFEDMIEYVKTLKGNVIWINP